MTLKHFVFVGIILVLSCNKSDTIDQPGEITTYIDALPETVIHPENNVANSSKIELGRLLFWDPILSGNKDVSCATCHHPDWGYADGIPVSRGVGGTGLGTARTGGDQTPRNAPTIINSAFNGIDENHHYDPLAAPMFWDNRANSLENQALLPILSKEEMRGSVITEEAIIDTLVNRLNAIPVYADYFNLAFGTAGITGNRILKAIAAFERTIIANNSPFDHYMRGDQNALTQTEQDGMQLFLESGCVDCHGGPMFSDFEPHVIGVPDGVLDTDTGTGAYAFRTPTLRNLAYTAPYMHNGIHETLEEVMEFYEDAAEGEGINSHISQDDLDIEMQDLELDGDDIELILEFLNTLNDPNFDKSIPESVPSALNVGGDIH